jgi:predicted DNA-binding ribbon-helix-helix protein
MHGKRDDILELERAAPDYGGHGNAKLQRIENGHLKSRVVKRSLVVGGHKTSVSLEDAFWYELRAIAQRRHMHLSQLVGAIDAERRHCNLSSAIRLFVFEQCRQGGEGSQGSPQ